MIILDQAWVIKARSSPKDNGCKGRTFKISKKAKFYGSDPERGFYRISKKSYKSILKSMNGLEVVFLVKKGKVVWMGFLS